MFELSLAEWQDPASSTTTRKSSPAAKAQGRNRYGLFDTEKSLHDESEQMVSRKKGGQDPKGSGF